MDRKQCIDLIKSWKTSAVGTTVWMVETQLCKLRGNDFIFHYKNVERSINAPHNDMMTARTLVSEYEGAWADWAAATTR